MGRAGVGVVLGAVLITALAGCASREPGEAIAGTPAPTSTKQPTPTSDKTTTVAPTTSASSGVARPKSIDLKAGDPCKILEKIAPEVGFQGKQLYPDTSKVFKNAPDCGVSLAPKPNGMTITFVPNVDAQWFGDNANGQVSKTTLAGFPGFTMTNSLGGACFVGVDVADQQMLHVIWNYTKPDNVPPATELCPEAVKATTAALKALGAS